MSLYFMKNSATLQGFVDAVINGDMDNKKST